jgi:hypothetical protein
MGENGNKLCDELCVMISYVCDGHSSIIIWSITYLNNNLYIFIHGFFKTFFYKNSATHFIVIICHK